MGSTHRLLHQDLKLKKRCAKLIPHVLTDHQKLQRRRFCQDFLQRCRLFRFHNWVITTDEAWFYLHEPGSRTENKQWITADENHPQVALRSRNCAKMMVIPFFDIRGLVDTQYFENRTITRRVFEPIIREVWQVLRLRRRAQWQQNHRIHLHMDNAPAHRGRDVRRALLEMEWQQIPHPPYSPDLSPCDFFLFPYLKRKLRGREYPNLDRLRMSLEREIGEITALQ